MVRFESQFSTLHMVAASLFPITLIALAQSQQSLISTKPFMSIKTSSGAFKILVIDSILTEARRVPFDASQRSQ
jgi:hypothetical protein